MDASIHSGTEIFGVTATISGFTLLVIWGLFLVLGLKIRRKGIRFTSVFLLVFTLSMWLGLWRPEVLSDGTVPGGAVGDWIYWNCQPTALYGAACFLAGLSAVTAFLLATDWLFIDYISSAVGLNVEPADGTPSAIMEKKTAITAKKAIAAKKVLAVKRAGWGEPPAENFLFSNPSPVAVEHETPVNDTSTAPLRNEEKPANQADARTGDSDLAGTETAKRWWESSEPEVDREEDGAGAGFEEEAKEETAEAPEAIAAQARPPDEAVSLLHHAALLAVEENDVSIAFLQKRLNLGYFRAAKLIDRMEKHGIVSPPEKDGTRSVVISKEAIESLLESEEKRKDR